MLSPHPDSRRRLAAAPVLLLLALLASCRPAARDDGTVLARVGREDITLAAVRAEAARLRLPADAVGLEPALRHLVERKALASEARAAGLDADPAIQAAHESLLASRWREQAEAALAPSEPTEAEVAAAYAERLAEFTRRARVRAALLRLPPGEAAAAAGLHGRLLDAEPAARAALFASLAEAHAADPETRHRGGDLGYLTEGRPVPGLPAEVLDRLFALTAPGEISPPVETPGGWFIVWLIERQPRLVTPLAEVAPALRERLRAEDAEAAARAVVERALARYATVHPERLPAGAPAAAPAGPAPAPAAP